MAIFPISPIAVDDDFVIIEDAVFFGNVLLSDLSFNGAPLQVLLVVLGNGRAANVGTPITLGAGKLTVNTNGTFSFDPTNGTPTLTDGYDFLRQGVTATERFTYLMVDPINGLTDQAIVTFTITGVNDIATISGTRTGSVTEDATTPNLTATGILRVADPDIGQNLFNTNVASAAGNLGNLSIAAGGAWNYSVANSAVQFLGAGATKTETFTVRSVDGTASQNIVVTINGVNDRATISGTATGSVTEDSATPNLTATGNLTVTDPDSAQNQFNTNVASAAGNLGTLAITNAGTWNYSVANSAVQFIGAGATKTETFTVRSVDGTASQNIVVTITGVNDPATISGTSTGSVTEDAATPNLTATGTLTINDVDTGENQFNPTVTPAAGNLGTLSIAAGGAWNYSVANSAVQFLGAGATKTETFTVQSVDGSATQDITVTITGVNDAPITDLDKTLTVLEDSALSPLGIEAPTDIDGDLLTIIVNSIPNPTKGEIRFSDGTAVTTGSSLTLDQLTNLVFAPIVNRSLDAGSFAYTVNDGNGGIVTQTISLFITPDNDGGAIGDPHLITFDGFHYDFQATGDFILVRGLDSDLEVQTRQMPWVYNPATTINTGLATLVDGNRVEFYVDQPLPLIDNQPLSLEVGQSQALGQGSISRTAISGYGMPGDLYTLTYANGDELKISVYRDFLIDVSIDLAGTKSVMGLLGNNNGNSGDDLSLRDGTILTDPLASKNLYGQFSQSWQVTENESLFSTIASSGLDSSGTSSDLQAFAQRYVLGANGDDILIGVDPTQIAPGQGKVDLFMGNKGADTFVLVDRNQPYYVGAGQQDYALITDLWAEDTIQLHGQASDYILGATPAGLAHGTAIFLDSDPNELIGIIQGDAISNLSLSNSSTFQFV